ncbi:helix-turn-helix transcriptional regulator [Paraburkholderia sp. SIMBA_027]|uniref:helix-turn-helix transcriptional regulator n=1 Tax=Paraburkholderia TaxID=1822464 RepID=UPI000F54707A|nr:helix-turn-helix transcriptional regulator [Paraburkholderia bannensis]RQM48677.1 XRE family transcriptional regulator [Paraburkholderia bannensis]
MNGLIALRKSLSMSQAEVGAAIGVTQSTISQCERGEILLSPDKAKRLVLLARARGVLASLDALYFGSPAAA